MKKRLTILGSAVVILALTGWIAAQFIGELLPKSAASGPGYIVDDELHEAMAGRFVFWLADCTSQPGSFSDLFTACGNLRMVEVDEEVWWQFSRGDYFPGA